MMKQLGHRYAQYFNRRYGRSGPLWGGRYYSCIAESARYVLACYRYIESNPVRANLVPDPGSYRWSSYTVNADGAGGGFLSPHEEFLALGVSDESRREAYKGLFTGRIEPSLFARIREATLGGYPLVSETFKSEMIAKTRAKFERDRPGPKPRSKQQFGA